MRKGTAYIKYVHYSKKKFSSKQFSDLVSYTTSWVFIYFKKFLSNLFQVKLGKVRVK